MKEICPLKFRLNDAIGTSAFGTGTEKRVDATAYSLFCVMNGEP